MSITTSGFKQVQVFEHKYKKEIPCKDMDLDCLPDERGEVPFGNYEKCYLYDQNKGICPFLPIDKK